MTAQIQQDIYVDSYCDLLLTLTLNGTNSIFAGITPSSAQLTFRQTPLDTTPLAQSTALGTQLIFGVAPPSPVGAQCTNLAELLALGPLTCQTAPPAPALATTANLTTLAALATANYTVGQFVFVQSAIGGQGGYYAWSPGDTNTPNGTTIIAGAGATGNWLWAVTLQVQIPASVLTPLVGMLQAQWDLLVTWGGTTSKIIEGNVYIDNSIGGH